RRRQRPVRASTLDLQRASKRTRKHLSVLTDGDLKTDHPRPQTRGDCTWCSGCQAWRDSRPRAAALACGHSPAEAVYRSRPCIAVGCHHHLYLDVVAGTGNLKLTFPDLEPDQLEVSCVLDAAENQGMTLEQVAVLLNVTRERVRQIEVMARTTLRNVEQSEELRAYLREQEEQGDALEDSGETSVVAVEQLVDDLGPL